MLAHLLFSLAPQCHALSFFILESPLNDRQIPRIPYFSSILEKVLDIVSNILATAEKPSAVPLRPQIPDMGTTAIFKQSSWK